MITDDNKSMSTKRSRIPAEISARDDSDLEDDELDTLTTAGFKEDVVYENNRFSVICPWEDPVSDDKKLTAVIGLPSGVIPEEVELSFEGQDKFTSRQVRLTYPWPNKLLYPQTVFSTECRVLPEYKRMSEYVSYRQVIRKMYETKQMSSSIVINLPFPVQRADNKWEMSLRAFNTSESNSVKESCVIKTSSGQLKKKCKMQKQYFYYCVIRMTGLEVKKVLPSKKKNKVVIIHESDNDGDDSDSVISVGNVYTK